MHSDPMRMQRRRAINANRRVSRLTDAEVQKKRAIDRDNQRHRREKDKAYIQSLQKQVTELTRQLEAQRLLLQCQSQQNTRTSSDGSMLVHQQSQSQSQSRSPSKYGSPPSFRTSEIDSGSEGPLSTLPLELAPGVTLNLSDADPGFNLLELGLPDHIASDAMYREEPSPHPSYQHNGDNTAPWNAVLYHQDLPDVPEWQRLPLHISPTTKLDEVIINTAHAWRQRALQPGHQEAELNDPIFPSIGSLLNRTSEAHHLRPLSVVLADQVGRTPLTSFPERLGFMYVLSHLMRWLVCRTKETYDGLPAFLRPTHLQRTVPHPAWIETIPWPEARDCMIRGEMDWSQFDAFRELSGLTMSVCWPYSDSDAVLESADGQLLMLNPVFVSHIEKTENWQVGKEVADRFPFMLPFIGLDEWLLHSRNQTNESAEPETKHHSNQMAVSQPSF